MNAWRNPGIWVLAAIVLVVGIFPIIQANDAQREVVSTMLISIALASSLNIILGYTGYVSFGHIVFFGLGGYTGLYMLNAVKAPLWLAMLSGGLAAGLLAFLLGKAILRLRGAYFALATIGVNEAMRAFIINFPPFGGPIGISLNFAIFLSYAIKNSKFGLGLLAIRENEDAAEVMGVVSPSAKTWAYVLSAVIPGIIGVLFYFKNGNVEPGDAFRLMFSIELLVMVMLGGLGTVTGPVLGAAGYQRLRGVLLTTPVLKDIQLVVAGAMLLAIILFIPAGAVGWLRMRFTRLRKVLP
jgi:branched-chain amino acid transport system permease protein